MNVSPHTLSLRRRLQVWPFLIAALPFLSSSMASAQTVQVNTGGIVSLRGVPPIYNDRYVLQTTDFGFLWLDTVALQGGIVQVEAKCGTGQPTPVTNIYVRGDCNGITNVDTAGTRVVARQLSGQCGVASLGCNGSTVDGTGFFEFKLGTWEYVGTTTNDILTPSTQTADLAGRTWKVTAVGDGKNFTFQASGNPNTPPTASASATNLSAANRTDKTNYYGDQWQLKDTSSTVSPITNVDWDLLYNGTYTKDEGGATDGTITGFFPCDPKGPIAGDIRLGTNCIQSLNMTNPAGSGNYRFAMQSANQNGTSANTFVSSPIAVQCAQANIVGFTGGTGTCAKSGGTLNVLVGGIADASGTQGNPISFDWTFPGTATPNVSGMTPGVPAGATTFTLAVTYPGGFQSTASGSVVQASLVASFTVAPNPVLINTQLTLTNKMQIATGTTLGSVDYLFNPGACTTPPPIASNPINSSFLVVNGSAAVNAPATKGDFCLYLKYNYSPPGGSSQIVSASVTTTDWVANPQILINPAPFCLSGPCLLSLGTTYSLSDAEQNIPLNPKPGAQWFLNGNSIGTSADCTVPISWTPNATCTNCSLTVTVNGVTSSPLPVTISNAQPTPLPTNPPGPTPTPPITGGNLSVSVTGPASGQKNTPLTYTANASGGSGGYSFFWQCDYNPLGSFAALGQTATCQYATSGAHTIVAMVRDSAGSSAVSQGFSVTIGGVGTPSILYTLTGSGVTQNPFTGRWSAPTSTLLTFTAGEANAATWTWAFGDGQTGTGRTVTHAYSSSGPYAAVLTVAGDEVNTSGTSTSTINIDITGPPGPSAAFTVSGATTLGPDSYEVEAFKSVTFTATETKANSYAWDFGDGTATGKTVTHAFSAAGNATAKLTVTGNGSDTVGTRSGTASFTVDPVKFRAIIVPGAAHLDLGSDVWGTDVTVSNPGADTLTITPAFVAYTDSGSDTSDLSQAAYDSKRTFQLAPGASWSQVDVVKALNGGSNKGTLVFKYDGSADPIVTARVYFARSSDPQGASYGAAFPSYKIQGGGVSTQAIEQAVSTDQTIIGLRSNDLYRFRVTLYNADSKAGTFRLMAYDQQGNQQFIKDATGQYVGFREFKIGGYQQSAPSDTDLGLVDSSIRYVLKASRTSTGGTLIASGTALDRKTSDLVQITDDTPTTQAESGVISYYVAGASHLDTQRAQWRTDLRIFNKSSNSRTLGFEYYFSHGPGTPEAKAQVVGITIPGNGLLTYDDIVDSLLKKDTTVNLTGDTSGMLRIFHFEDADSATKPLVISSRNYDDPSDGTGTAGTQLGVYSSLQSTKPGGSPLLVAGAEDSDRFYSVIGLFALDSAVTTGRISAVGPDGKEVGSFDFALNQNDQGGAGHFGQIFLKSLSNWTNPGVPVTIKVTVNGGGRVGAYAVTVDLKTNDLTFIQGRPQF